MALPALAAMKYWCYSASLGLAKTRTKLFKT